MSDSNPDSKPDLQARIQTKSHLPPEELASAALAYENPEFLNSADGRLFRILGEYQEPMARFRRERIQDTVVFFGSARFIALDVASHELELLDNTGSEATRPRRRAARQRHRPVNATGEAPAAETSDAPAQRAEAAVEMARYYEDARTLAGMVSKWAKLLPGRRHRFVITSGGGPGIMEAANRGAYEAGGKTIGLNIKLPFEQRPNPYITPELNFEFHYFFMRKYWFAYLAKALVVFPGGFGTLDEMFELLTLAQTQKLAKQITVVIYGSDYWKNVINLEELADKGAISARTSTSSSSPTPRNRPSTSSKKASPNTTSTPPSTSNNSNATARSSTPPASPRSQPRPHRNSSAPTSPRPARPLIRFNSFTISTDDQASLSLPRPGLPVRRHGLALYDAFPAARAIFDRGRRRPRLPALQAHLRRPRRRPQAHRAHPARHPHRLRRHRPRPRRTRHHARLRRRPLLGEYSAHVAAGTFTFATPSAPSAPAAASCSRPSPPDKAPWPPSSACPRTRSTTSAPRPRSYAKSSPALEPDTNEPGTEVSRDIIAESTVSPANLNSPDQTVISGATAAVHRAADLCKAAGAKRPSCCRSAPPSIAPSCSPRKNPS